MPWSGVQPAASTDVRVRDQWVLQALLLRTSERCEDAICIEPAEHARLRRLVAEIEGRRRRSRVIYKPSSNAGEGRRARCRCKSGQQGRRSAL